MKLFESARLRVSRAQDRAREMSEVWNDYLTPDPFEALLLRVSPTQYVVRLEQTEPVPLELSALFGEWLYNLRSALDHIVWASAAYAAGSVPPDGEDRLQYPIYDTEDRWIRNRWRLKSLPTHQVEMLHRMQPFNSNSDANFLRWINELARIDRHRHLTMSTARVAQVEPVIKIPSGVAPTWEWGQRVFSGGRCDLARVTFPDADSAAGVSCNPRVGIDPEIVEWSASDFWKNIRFSERLNMLMISVKAEIDVYDYDCTGAPAARRTVASAFADESDRRREAGLFPPFKAVTPEPPTWTPAGSPRVSNMERFMGHDFPADGNISAYSE